MRKVDGTVEPVALTQYQKLLKSLICYVEIPITCLAYTLNVLS